MGKERTASLLLQLQSFVMKINASSLAYYYYYYFCLSRRFGRRLRETVAARYGTGDETTPTFNPAWS